MKDSYFATDRGGRLHYQYSALMNGKSVAKLRPNHIIIWNPKNNTRSWYWEDKQGKIRYTTEFRRYDNVDYIATINDHKLRKNANLRSKNWMAIDYSNYCPDELKNTTVHISNKLYKVFDKCFECDCIIRPELLLGYYGYVKDDRDGVHLDEGLEKDIRINFDIDYSIEQFRKRKNVIVYKEDIRHWAKSWFLGGGQIFDDNYESFYNTISCRLNGARRYYKYMQIALDRHNIPYEVWSLDTGDFCKTFDVEKSFDTYETSGTDTLLPEKLFYKIDEWIDRYMSEYPPIYHHEV
tara:strand:+ start:791 stop:1672 length:882 start_codon:yes stop_codon:yes gene_type:complete